MDTPEMTPVVKSRFSIDAILMTKRKCMTSPSRFVNVTPTYDARIRTRRDGAPHDLLPTARRSPTPEGAYGQSPDRCRQMACRSEPIRILPPSGSSPLDLTKHSIMTSRPEVHVTPAVDRYPDIESGLSSPTEFRNPGHLSPSSSGYEDNEDVIDVEVVRQREVRSGFRPLTSGSGAAYSADDDSDITSGE